MESIALLITLLFDALVLPFGRHHAAALVIVSILSGAAFALVFRATSKPDRITRARGRFQARVLEMRLYPDDVVLLTRALLGALATQIDYFRAAGKPILIVLIVALPVYFQLESRFAGRPLHASERALVTATVKPGLDARAIPAELTGSDGLLVDPRSVRVRATREIAWRVEAKAAAVHHLTARVYDVEYRFPVQGSSRARALGRERSAGPFWSAFVHPGLPSIPDNSAIETVRVSYPEQRFHLLGVDWDWLGVFLTGTLVGAAIPAVLLRIQM
ncbi:MAG TPA: hypothetical protein VEC56_03745 [Candidatus Krumholzibacteria bacterium]|nr:hypothetical protein [Candidatus Krumholzibacteria bacterium]